MKALFFKLTICFSCGILAFTSINAQDKSKLSISNFDKQSYAIIEGKFEGDIPDSLNAGFMPLIVNNFIFYDNYKVEINKDHTFSLKVPIAETTFGGFQSPLYQGRVVLTPNTVTHLNIRFDKDGEQHIDMTNSLGIGINDLMQMDDVENDILTYSSNNEYSSDFTMSPDSYFTYSYQRLDKAINDLKTKNQSVKIENLILYELKAFFLDAQFLDYRKAIYLKYKNSTHDTIDFATFKEKFKVVVPDSSYYRKVFEYLKPNDPGYLSATYMGVSYRNILTDKDLNIPPIGDLAPDVWLGEVKNILSHAIGVNHSQFCQLLTAAAYVNQLEYKTQPLSEKQRENIQNYYKGTALQTIILTKDKAMTDLMAKKSTKSVINPTPAVAPDKMIDVIVAKYKGKTVLIDFWATWCGPCLKAMLDVDLIKKNYVEKGVVFVYITDVSSPKGIWREKIKDIEGEHYYLSKEDWEKVLNQYGFEMIPSYLIFDKDGTLKQKKKGYYPGNEAIEEMLKNAL